MLHYKKFETDKDFADWQFANNKQIHQIFPIALDTDLAPREENGGQVTYVRHGIMVIYSENRSLARNLLLVSMMAIERHLRGDEGTSEFKMMLNLFKKENGMDYERAISEQIEKYAKKIDDGEQQPRK